MMTYQSNVVPEYKRFRCSRITSSFYFILVIRGAAVFLALLAVILCITSPRWHDQLSSSIGLFFAIISLISMACGIGLLCYYDLVYMGLPRILIFISLLVGGLSRQWAEQWQSLFAVLLTVLSAFVNGISLSVLFYVELKYLGLPRRVLTVLIGAISSLAAGVLFILSVHTCEHYSPRLGCLDFCQASGMVVAGVFALLSLLCNLCDLLLQLLFYKREEDDQTPERSQPIHPVPDPPKSVGFRSTPDVFVSPFEPRIWTTGSEFGDQATKVPDTPPRLLVSEVDTEPEPISSPIPPKYYLRRTVHTDV